ncbi:hypothetical protein T484DRAFT_1814183, partial [Baffinella frigidus]
GAKLLSSLPNGGDNFVSDEFSEDVGCIATDGQATVLFYSDGDWGSSGGLNKVLHDAMKRRSNKDPPPVLHDAMKRRSNKDPPPVYASLGSDGRFYVKFGDNEAGWNGSDDMAK